MLSKNGLMNDMQATMMLKLVAITVAKTVLKLSNVGSSELLDENM